jgi:hypothetical protein
MSGSRHLDWFWVGQDVGIRTPWWVQAASQGRTDHHPFAIASNFPVPAGTDSPVAAVAGVPRHLDFWIGQIGGFRSQWSNEARGQS